MAIENSSLLDSPRVRIVSAKPSTLTSEARGNGHHACIAQECVAEVQPTLVIHVCKTVTYLG